MKDIVDEVLKCAFRIGEAEWHDGVLVVSEACPSRSPLFMSLSYANQVLGAAEVELGEPFCF